MTTLEEELRDALRTQAQTLRVPERPTLDRDIVELRRRPGQRWLIAAACLALTLAGVASFAQWQAGDPASVVSSDPDITAPAPGMNGWVALESTDSEQRAGAVPDRWPPRGGDIYLVRPGEDARRLEVAGSDTAAEACPVWSPDGTRLLFGRLTGSSDTLGDTELVIVSVDQDGAVGDPTVITLDGFDALEGFDPYPCGTWAPDGRWVALRGPGEVWLVDTQTSAIRRLPDLRPIDLEWRPGTDELAIAGDMGTTRAADWVSTPVHIYSVSTGELRQLGSIRAGHVTWSPDGSTLAHMGTEDDPSGLWLVDAAGSNEQLLVADTGEAIHGIGPVWSPTGDRIAYQRHCCQGAETHEIVIASTADGTETVIEPPDADESDRSVRWYPFTVSWSPDGTTLLSTAWRSRYGPGSREFDGRTHVITVPADAPRNVTVLALGGIGAYTDHQWVVTQMWGRQPE